MNQKFYRYISFFGLSFLREQNFQQLRMLEKDVYLFLKDLAIKNGADPKNIKSQIYQDILSSNQKYLDPIFPYYHQHQMLKRGNHIKVPHK